MTADASSSESSPCWVCQATPIGRGAIATILVLGNDAAHFVDRCFQPAASKPLVEFPIDRIVFGRWRDESGAGEELVVARRAEDRVEVHCHGGSAACESVIASLVDAGCQRTTWQDATAWLESDAIVAEARVALAAASTQRTARHLLAQHQGALSRSIGKMRNKLQTPTVTPDEVTSVLEDLRALAATATFGLHLTQPWKVVLAGRANVGKSSLINVLLGYDRAIVFDQPGTTRDVLKAETAIDGWPIQLADTAGLRKTTDAIEAVGHEFAVRSAKAADLLLLVFDHSQPWTDEDQQLCDMWPLALFLHNKCDLAKQSSNDRPTGLSLSAVTGKGIDKLLDIIAGRLVPAPPSESAAVIFTARQQQLVTSATRSLEKGDTVAAVQHLSELIGGG